MTCHVTLAIVALILTVVMPFWYRPTPLPLNLRCLLPPVTCSCDTITCRPPRAARYDTGYSYWYRCDTHYDLVMSPASIPLCQTWPAFRRPCRRWCWWFWPTNVALPFLPITVLIRRVLLCSPFCLDDAPADRPISCNADDIFEFDTVESETDDAMPIYCHSR